MNYLLSFGRPTLSLLALTLAGCASGSPMKLVPVDVEPVTVGAKVYLHENLGSIKFDPVRTSRTEGAKLLDVQCRITNESEGPAEGTFLVEFLDGTDRQVSNSGERQFTIKPGGTYVVEARATSPAAKQVIISIRP